jgi:hypothetical protein
MRAFTTAALAGLLVSAANAAPEPINPEREPTFPRSGKIHGYLVDPAGQGLRGIVAICTVDGRELDSTHSVQQRRGRFEFDAILPGTYILRVKTVGPVTSDLAPAADQQVTVRSRRVERPHLVARTAPRTP